MKKTIKAFFKITGSASNRWWGKDPFMQSAVIAYYAIFSMPGLLVIVISVGSLLLSEMSSQGNYIHRYLQ
jgi:membrane protein